LQIAEVFHVERCIAKKEEADSFDHGRTLRREHSDVVYHNEKSMESTTSNAEEAIILTKSYAFNR
jgi:hypothetical protein